MVKAVDRFRLFFKERGNLESERASERVSERGETGVLWMLMWDAEGILLRSLSTRLQLTQQQCLSAWHWPLCVFTHAFFVGFCFPIELNMKKKSTAVLSPSVTLKWSLEQQGAWQRLLFLTSCSTPPVVGESAERKKKASSLNTPRLR